jgi:NADH dehydrogenase [ubiquinone] 1 alpha subcomplex assembly factor 7
MVGRAARPSQGRTAGRFLVTLALPWMSDRVAEALQREIRARGPIGFDRFMDLALYGPGGFYEAPPIGPGGHFVTSPHVHPVFATLLARAIRELAAGLGGSAPVRLVELGAGDGTLAVQLLRELEGLPLEYAVAERSPGARAALSRLPVRIVDHAAPLDPGFHGIVLANELLDNFPFRRVRSAEATPTGYAGAGLVEVLVGLAGDRFVEVEAPCPPDLAALAPALRPGEEGVVPVAALDLIDRLAAALARGHVLLIDYGDDSGGPAGPVHGYRGHEAVADVLSEPGTADLTAGVDFRAVAGRARAAGFEVHGPMTQEAALRALGYDRWARDERTRQTRLLDAGSGLDAARAWGGRSRASLLVDPSRLGGLRWLLLATPGLPAPPWIAGFRPA